MTKLRFHYLLFCIIVSGFICLSTIPSFSQDDEGCLIQIQKRAPIGELFEFTQNLNGVESTIFIQSFGEQADIPIEAGDVLTITENVPDGWVLEDVGCIDVRGVLVTEVENGLKFECIDSAGFSGAACSFFDRLSAEKIPTLSEWGMISAAVGLGLIGLFFVARRKRILNQI